MRGEEAIKNVSSLVQDAKAERLVLRRRFWFGFLGQLSHLGTEVTKEDAAVVNRTGSVFAVKTLAPVCRVVVLPVP